MVNYLIEEREQKKNELLNKETLLKQLESETNELENKETQAKIIEKNLSSYYEKLQEKNRFDRSIEPEIKENIKKKNKDIDNAISIYNSEVSLANRIWSSRCYYSNERFPSYNWWDYKSYDEWEKKKASFEKAEERKKAKYNKERDKEYDDSCKAAAKKCIEVLKRIFGELEIDLKRYYKKGISKNNLDELVKIMDKIYDNGSKIGTIPLSYQQKIYKWEQYSKEAGIDEERINSEKEEAENKKELEKLNIIKSKRDSVANDISKANSDLEKYNKQLNQLNVLLNNYETNNPIYKEKALTNAEERKKEAIRKCESKEQELKKEFDEKKKRVNTEIETVGRQLSEKQEEIQQTSTEKENLENELNKVFALSFGKKRELKEKISEKAEEISHLEQIARKHLSKLDELNNKNLLLDLNSAIKKEEAALSDEIRKIDEIYQKELSDLNHKLEATQTDIKKTEKLIPPLKVKLKELQSSLERNNESLSAAMDSVRDFHKDYLIKNYGGKIIGPILKENNNKIKTLKTEIKNLQKDIASLDIKIENKEKEKALQFEELKKERIRKALQEEQARARQEEIRQRFEKEQEEKEQEQVLIDKNIVSLNHLKLVAVKIEKDPVFYDSLNSNCPLTDDGNHVITNSILRKRFVQKNNISESRQYLLVFIDKEGNEISDRRLVNSKETGKDTVTSFELRANNGFADENYYLLILDFETGEVVGAQRYKINIVFANEFDF